MTNDELTRAIENGTLENPMRAAIRNLRKMGRTLHARYEDSCNGTTAPEDMNEEGDDLVAWKMQDDADKLAASVGLHVYHQTDPRGWPLYISFDPIPEDDYNRAAIALDCRK